MVTKYFIKKGFVYKDSKSSDNGFDLLRWLKRVARYLHITTFDPCCDTESEILPLRFNSDPGVIETVDPATGEWVPLEFNYDSEGGNITISVGS